MADLTPVNQVFSLTDRELWLVSAVADGIRAGLIATFVNQASIVPDMPRVLVGLAQQHHTAQVVARSGRFLLHLLTEDQIDLVWRFGLHSGRAGDKWNGVACIETATGPRLTGALAWVECRVEAALNSGDRTVYLAAVEAADVQRSGPPLTMRRLIELAPAERLREMKAGLERDAVIDAAAIAAWRVRSPLAG
jgi:flavin reductase (DIM6/NTAB) family NADH-FMN oxidoreductase RutF